jgi:hypothetical protein
MDASFPFTDGQVATDNGGFVVVPRRLNRRCWSVTANVSLLVFQEAMHVAIRILSTATAIYANYCRDCSTCKLSKASYAYGGGGSRQEFSDHLFQRSSGKEPGLTEELS